MSLQRIELDVCDECRDGNLDGEYVAGCAICAVVIAVDGASAGDEMEALRGATYRELLAAGARIAEGSRLLPTSEARA